MCRDRLLDEAPSIFSRVLEAVGSSSSARIASTTREGCEVSSESGKVDVVAHIGDAIIVGRKSPTTIFWGEEPPEKRMRVPLLLDGEAGVPPGSLHKGRLMAVQVAKNKTTSENDIEAVVRDYATAVGYVGKYADILVVNVSSPNTPGLRTLQNVEPLTRLLSGVVSAVKNIDRKTKPAIMVKVSPDEDSEEQISGICEAVWDSGVDGVIVGNTTKKRPDPLPKGYLLSQSEAKVLLEQGGYSGPQMFERTLALVKKYRKALDEGPKQITLPTQSEDMKLSAVQSQGDEPLANTP